MKRLTTSEKFGLIRHHGDYLSRTMTSSIIGERRADVIDRAQRIIELAKSISKEEFGE